MLPVYIINLTHEKDRLKNTLLECRKNNLTNITRINAVYGKNLSSREIKKNTSFVCSKMCTYSTIGCAMSHKKAWETFLKSGHEFGLIFEDDIYMEDNFKHELKQKMKNVPNDLDILYLGCAVGCKDKDKYNLDNMLCGKLYNSKGFRRINKDIIVPDTPLGLHAYILSRKGAEKLLNSIANTKIYTHIDVQMLIEGQELKVYATDPLIVYQKVDTSSSSIASTYPAVINSYLHKHESDHRIPHSYKLSVPFCEIFSLPINGYALMLMIFFLVYSTLSEINLLFVTLFFFVYNIFELKMYPSNLSLVVRLYIWIIFWIYIGRRLKRMI
jgi:glycosyl transferase family 25